MNKKDIRVQKTYQALIDAFLKLQKTQTFDSISINDLCKESKIGRATFYRHFKNKDDFLQYAAQRWVNKYLEVAFENLDSFIEQRQELLSRIIGAMFNFLNENRLSLLNANNINMPNVFFKTFQETIQKLIDEYCIMHGVKFNGDSSLVSSEIAGGIVYAGSWFQQHPEADIDETIEAVTKPLDRILNIYFPTN
ncbi:TetR/AcrR family transcriptional regulator [Lactobacillaceae bacterium Melli_B4]